jgi:hypothetical protein
MYTARMREIGLLILSLVVTWAGSTIALKAQQYKEELAAFDHPIAFSPIWAIRALGALIAAAGLFVFYEFLRS